MQEEQKSEDPCILLLHGRITVSDAKLYYGLDMKMEALTQIS
jgi:hypothetical protein